MTAQLEKRLLTVQEYEKMYEAGILTEDDRVELLNGELIQMSPIGPRHAGMVNRLTNIFAIALAGKAIVAPQNPVVPSDLSEPQPDLAILRPRPDYYTTAHPRPEDILLLIEVAESSVEKDRNLKLAIYAEAGIAEYWIVNLEEQVLEVYQQPEGRRYKLRRLLDAGDEVRIATLDRTFVVGELIG